MREHGATAEAGKVNHLGKGAMLDTGEVGVFLGLDVGKTAHHGHGLTPAGKKVFDKLRCSSTPSLE
ncbi:hypothetical protein ACFZBM_32545 [Streptomyces lavendulae]|uniref:hypothetical protein n=1 Tax=Streptomyces lavendulae TaxID=1914 RepID=UPI0036E0A0A2